jgi:hypothetical protein
VASHSQATGGHNQPRPPSSAQLASPLGTGLQLATKQGAFSLQTSDPAKAVLDQKGASSAATERWPEPASLADATERPHPPRLAREDGRSATPPPSSRPHEVPAARSGGGEANFDGWRRRLGFGCNRPSPARGNERAAVFSGTINHKLKEHVV